MEAATGHRAGASATRRYRRERRRRRAGHVEVAAWLAVAAVAGGFALVHHARLPGVAAVAAVVIAVVRRPRPDPERWLRGAAGERATAEVLAALPRRRWEVLHDRRVPGTGANVDHLVIGPRGVWVVDSKAYRAPLRAGWRSVRVGDRRLDPSAAAWEAEVVADLLDREVRPLVVVHGRGLPERGRRCDGVRVVPAAGALRRLRRERFGPRLGRSARAELADVAAEVLPEA